MKAPKVVRGGHQRSNSKEAGKYELCKFSDIVPLLYSGMTQILPLKIGIFGEWLL